MKKALKLVVAFVVITVLVYFVIYGRIFAEKKGKFSPDTDDIVKLEDAIIIRSIKMTSDTPMEEAMPDPSVGEIIYDNSFDNSIREYKNSDKGEKYSSVKKEPVHVSSKSAIISKLRKFWRSCNRGYS